MLAVNSVLIFLTGNICQIFSQGDRKGVLPVFLLLFLLCVGMVYVCVSVCVRARIQAEFRSHAPVTLAGGRGVRDRQI